MSVSNQCFFGAKSIYKTHYESQMVAKFLDGLSPKRSAIKINILTGDEIFDMSMHLFA